MWRYYINDIKQVYLHSKDKKYVDDNAGGGGGMSDLVDDTTPQLGGDLDVNTIYLYNNSEVLYNVDTDIGGFQFDVIGSTVASISGGDAAAARRRALLRVSPLVLHPQRRRTLRRQVRDRRRRRRRQRRRR